MATLTATFQNHMGKSAIHPIVLVALDVSASKTLYAAKSDRLLSLSDITAPIPLSIAEVDPIEQKVDVLQPKIEVPELNITWRDDGYLAEIIKNYRLKNKSITVTYGPIEAAASTDLVDYFTGIVDDIEMKRDDGEMTMRCHGAWSIPRDFKVTGRFYNKHPLEYIERLLNKAGVPAALIDSTAFDPDTYTGSISHWATARSTHWGNQVRAVTDPEECIALIEELVRILDGTIYQKEDGVITFVRYDKTAASVATFDASNSRIRQRSLYGDMYNRCRISHAWKGGGSKATIRQEQQEHAGEYTLEFLSEDQTAQSNYAYPGGADHIPTVGIESRWLSAEARLQNNIGSAQLSLTIEDWNTHSMTGARSDGSSGWSLSASRPAYYQLIDTSGAFGLTSTPEIIKVTGLTLGVERTQDPVPNGLDDDTTHYDPEIKDLKVTADLTVPAGGRAQFGTAARVHKAESTVVVDVTVQVALAQAIVDRFSDGAPPLQVETTLDFDDVELSNMVTLITDQYSRFGKDGTGGSGEKFQVVGKRKDPAGSGTLILDVLWVQSGTPGQDYIIRDPGGILKDKLYLRDKLVSRGLDAFVKSGRTVTLQPGRGFIGDRLSFDYQEPIDVDLGDIADDIEGDTGGDVYIGIDTGNGFIVKEGLASGATPPAERNGWISLWEFDVGTASITGNADWRKHVGRANVRPELLGGAVKSFNAALEYSGEGLVENAAPDFWRFDRNDIAGTDFDWETTAANVLSGTRALKLISGKTPVAYYGPFLVGEGTRCRVGAIWSSSSAGAGKNFSMDVVWLKADGIEQVSTVGAFAKQGLVSNTYQLNDQYMTPPANARMGMLKMYHSGSHNVLVDRVILEEEIIADGLHDSIIQNVLAYPSSAQAIAAFGVATKVLFQNERWDRGGRFSSSRFTADQDGTYIFSWRVEIANVAANKVIHSALRKNGSTSTEWHGEMQTAFGSATDLSTCGSVIIELSATDYAEVFADQNSTTSRNTNPAEKDTFFSGALIAPH